MTTPSSHHQNNNHLNNSEFSNSLSQMLLEKSKVLFDIDGGFANPPPPKLFRVAKATNENRLSVCAYNHGFIFCLKNLSNGTLI